MRIQLLMICALFTTAANAAVDLTACVQRLEVETAEQEMVNRQESGEDVGALTCKLSVRSQRDGTGACEKVLKYDYVCNPGAIKGSGGACCPG